MRVCSAFETVGRILWRFLCLLLTMKRTDAKRMFRSVKLGASLKSLAMFFSFRSRYLIQKFHRDRTTNKTRPCYRSGHSCQTKHWPHAKKYDLPLSKHCTVEHKCSRGCLMFSTFIGQEARFRGRNTEKIFMVLGCFEI